MDESESGFAFLGTVVAANALQNIKPALTTQFRSLILKGVENGKLDSALTGTEDTSLAMNLAVVARNISADRIEIGEITNIKQEGATATADLPIRNMLLDTTLVLRLRLEKGDDAWRVVAPDNLSEYLEIVDRLQEQRLSEANERARQAMQDIVSVSDVRRSVRKYYYLNDDLILATTLRNIGRDTITAVVFNTDVNGKEMDPSDGWLIYFHTITPGASAQISRTYDYNPYMDSHQLLRYGSITVQPFLIVRRIAGRPDTLMRFNTWSDYAERQ